MAGLTMEELNQLVAAKLAEQQERAAAGAQVGLLGWCWGACQAPGGGAAGKGSLSGRENPESRLQTELLQTELNGAH